MRPRPNLPDDSALPALVAIREVGLAAAVPAMGLTCPPDEVLLCGYTPGSRATLEVRAGHLHFAVKAYAEDPAPEAALYESIAASMAAAAVTGVRVPPLLAWDPELKLLAIGWLDGPSTEQLVKQGQGARAGKLAAQWTACAAGLPVRLGRRISAANVLSRARSWVASLRDADPALGITAQVVVTMLALSAPKPTPRHVIDRACTLRPASLRHRTRRWIVRLRAADPLLGAAAAALTGTLTRTQPQESGRHLVHGTLYCRHILDVGGGPGVIDWQRFGQGPLEFDAGVFLATISRLALRHEDLADAVAQAEKAFRSGTAHLLNERALAWYRAAALLRLASKPVSGRGIARLRARKGKDWEAVGLARAHALLNEAVRVAKAAG